MNAWRHGNATVLRQTCRRFFMRLIVTLTAGVSALMAKRTMAGGAGAPSLQFIEPAERAVYSTLDEIPIVLRAMAADDVVLSAEVLADGAMIATAQYCCPMCPCPNPPAGQATILRIPVPWKGSTPPSNPWQGWRPNYPGIHRLTARAVGQKGTVLTAGPLTVIVVDWNMHMMPDTDGNVRFVLPQGSLVPGRFEMEASGDLMTWVRLGPFHAGNVAAFFSDTPPAGTRRRYYRAVYVPK